MATSGDRGYEFFGHTADVGMVVRGETLEELCVHAAQGLVELLVEQSVVVPREARRLTLTASSAPALLQCWLTELLIWFDTDRFLPVAYEFVTVTETSLAGQVRGERFDPQRHAHGVEVKGITRHEFVVERPGGTWRARIIVDV